MISHFSRVQLLVTPSMDCSPPVSSVRRILQARILEWVTMSSSRGSSQSRDQTLSSYGFCTAGKFFYRWAAVEAQVVRLQLIIIVNICRAHAVDQPCAKPSQMLPLQPSQQSFTRYNHSHFTNELIGGPGKLKNVSEITHLINEGTLIQILNSWVSQPGTFYSQTPAILQNPRNLKSMETPQVSTPSLYTD